MNDLDGHDLTIHVEDDWNIARPVTTIKSGPAFLAPVSAALLFSKHPSEDRVAVSLAVDDSVGGEWTSHQLLQAIQAFVKDFVANVEAYGKDGLKE